MNVHDRIIFKDLQMKLQLFQKLLCYGETNLLQGTGKIRIPFSSRSAWGCSDKRGYNDNLCFKFQNSYRDQYKVEKKTNHSLNFSLVFPTIWILINISVVII